MADFFGKEGSQEETIEEATKISVGEKEYSQEDLKSLVGLAERTQELEEKYNTKFDKVWPAYGKSQAELKTRDEKIIELEAAAKKALDVPDEKEEQAVEEAKEAARKLGLVLGDDLEDLGIVTKKDFKNLFNEMRSGEKLLSGARTLEKEYDGTDGRPKFDVENILIYMQDTGINDPRIAYKVKYEDQLSSWKETKIKDAKRGGLDTIDSSTAGSKEPERVKVTRDNLENQVREALEGKI